MNKKYKWISIGCIIFVIGLALYNFKFIEDCTRRADNKFCIYLDNASKSLVYDEDNISEEEELAINNAIVKNLFAALEIYDYTSYKSVFGEDLKECIVQFEIAMNKEEANTTILYREREKILYHFSYVVSDVIKNEKNDTHITGFLNVIK